MTHRLLQNLQWTHNGAGDEYGRDQADNQADCEEE
jgi:hypothetical protein